MISDGVTLQAVANYTLFEAHATFLNGDAVFCRNGPYMYEAGDPERSKITLNQVGFSPLPVGEGLSQSASCLGGWNMLISASSEMQDEAWAFVQFMTSEESQKKYSITASTLPTLKTLYDDREILEKVPVVDLSKEALQNASPVQFRPTTRRCLPRWPSSSTTSLEALSHLELPSSLSRATYSGSSSRANKPSQTEASPRILLTLRPCSLAPSVTTPHYSTTVAKALQQPLRDSNLWVNITPPR